ncbi:MAG: hypothetical protein D6820_07325 [Lentisphaerae bacterium]|nr:MAG: hypothetical protein D6820_07325 [Lentisphaerota bacterium]
MADDPHYYTRDIEVNHLITRDKQKALLFRPQPGFNRIIRANEVTPSNSHCCVIGGDNASEEHEDAPAIVIEKDGDVIRRILVTCPCGRTAELVCTPDEEPPEPTDEP